jgi:hypothetical protein
VNGAGLSRTASKGANLPAGSVTGGEERRSFGHDGGKSGGRCARAKVGESLRQVLTDTVDKSILVLLLA